MRTRSGCQVPEKSVSRQGLMMIPSSAQKVPPRPARAHTSCTFTAAKEEPAGPPSLSLARDYFVLPRGARTMPHSWHDVTPGARLPGEFTVVIEIPMGSNVKYE